MQILRNHSRVSIPKIIKKVHIKRRGKKKMVQQEILISYRRIFLPFIVSMFPMILKAVFNSRKAHQKRSKKNTRETCRDM
jgi:hypothetical protein